jgi:hypothetical protein
MVNLVSMRLDLEERQDEEFEEFEQEEEEEDGVNRGSDSDFDSEEKDGLVKFD